MVVFAHPSAVKEIFTADPGDLRAGEANLILRNVIGDRSLFVLDGDRHDRHRRAMTPPFQGECLRSHGAVMAKAAARAVRKFPREASFLAYPYMQSVTLEIILDVLLGASPESFRQALYSAVHRFTDLATRRLGTLAAMLLPPGLARTIARLAGASVQIGRRQIGLSAIVPGNRVVRAQRDLGLLLHAELARRRGLSENDGDDVLSSLMAAHYERRSDLSDEDLHDEVITLVLAGHETSAGTLAWAVQHLAEQPGLQSELRAEALSSHGNLEDCVLLDAVVKEALRKTPVVPVIPRRLGRPMRIGGYTLPRGTVVAVSPYLTQHRGDLWERPWRFDPTRFIGKRIDPYQFFPFGGGARRCPGMAFALGEIKAVLGEMVRCLAWNSAQAGPVTHERRGILVAPSGGVPIVARDVVPGP
jgi:cytochrome P450